MFRSKWLKMKETHHSADWIKSVDRGGLVHVDDMTYTVFVEIELVTRRYLNSKSARDVNMSSIVELIMVDMCYFHGPLLQQVGKMDCRSD